VRVGVIASHPIQYQAPWFRELAPKLDLHVYFAQRHSGSRLAKIGFGVNAEWDVDLLSGYEHTFLDNKSKAPDGFGFSSSDTPELWKIISKGKFDAFIINGWFLKSYVQALAACTARGIPALVRGDSQLAMSTSKLRKTVKSLTYPFLLRTFSACLYVGTRNREYLESYGVAAERLFHAPHAVDNRRFAERAAQARNRRTQLRSELGFEERDVIALFVGRLVESKHPEHLIRALQQVPSDLRVRPAFVGTGPLEPELRARAAQAGIEAVFLGFRNQQDLPDMYAAADFLVLPSDGSETWGLVVNEGMACGLPAIVSRAVGCSPDLIDEAKTGYSFPFGDIPALARAIAKLVPVLGSKYVNAAVERKCSQFSIERAGEGTLEALRYAVKKESRARPLA
jgi:glycosyltransferase involved in cell wall biosynthesis